MPIALPLEPRQRTPAAQKATRRHRRPGRAARARRRAAPPGRSAPAPPTAPARAAARSARSFVKRRSERPDWRVPSSWPSPRSSRSTSASSKPSVVSTSASSRRTAVSVSSSFGRETSRQYDCSAPRPTRPRSWCSCARPKRSASWTIITVAFGTSTPTSITVVATSTSSSRALNRAIRSRRSAGFSLPCRQPTRNPRSSARWSRAASCSAARARERLGLLDQRADDVCLPALLRSRVSRRYASEARRSSIQLVTIGLREAGGFAISLTDRSP